MTVNKAYIQNGDEMALAYYWFPMRGRVLTNLYQLKIYTFWDPLTRRRTDGALVRVMTGIGRDETLNDADVRLRTFLLKVTPLLDEYIPK